MVDRLVRPQSGDSIIDGRNAPTQEFDTWLQIINERSLIIGDGSPESMVEAPRGAQYMDISGATGTILYIKQFPDIVGDSTQGWTLV